MKKVKLYQRFPALAAALAVALLMSPVAESRPREVTQDRTSAVVAAIIDAMNDQRANHGLPALAYDERLAAAANDRAEDMIERGYFDHVDPEGRSPFLAVKAHGYEYRAVGENLAVGYDSARAVVDGWMRSPGHRANILSPRYREVGVAIDPRPPVRPFGGPTVVAMYGAERG